MNNLCRLSCFYDSSVVQDIGSVTKAADQRKVMGDKQDRKLFFLADPGQQLHDLRLYGHIQRRGGLITDKETRILCDRPCDRRPLAFSATDLPRIHSGIAAIQSDQLKQMPDFPLLLFLIRHHRI